MSQVLRMMARSCAAMMMLLPALAGPARSAAFDTPTISFVDAGLFQVTLRVQAGVSGATNGFQVDWMRKSDYDRLGGWPVGPDPALVFCAYVGTPTLNLWGASDFRLGPQADAMIQPGDLFDETGVVTSALDELQPGLEYVFRARAREDAVSGASGYSATLGAQTAGSAECTQGFWKNHPDVWPPSCTPIMLGTVTYSKADLLAIFGEPAVGNGLISLAHQLITAKLNVCNGSSPAPIAATIAAADALIGGLVCPPIGSGYLQPSLSSPLTEKLDRFNNGKLGGVIDCPTAVRSRATWGLIKTLYR